MTVRIRNLPTEIATWDRLALRTMVESVMANRPSFRTVRAKIEGENVEIYTRCDRTGGEETLVVAGPDKKITLRAGDRDELQSLADQA